MLLKKKLLSKKHDLYLTRNKKYPSEGYCTRCRRYPCDDFTMDDCKDIDKSVGLTHSFTYIVL